MMKRKKLLMHTKLYWKKLVLFNYIKIKIIKIDALNKGIGSKSCSRNSFELVDVCVKPNRIAQIKLLTDLLESPEDLVSPSVIYFQFDSCALKHTIIFKGSCPYSKHKFASYMTV